MIIILSDVMTYRGGSESYFELDTVDDTRDVLLENDHLCDDNPLHATNSHTPHLDHITSLSSSLTHKTNSEILPQGKRARKTKFNWSLYPNATQQFLTV